MLFYRLQSQESVLSPGSSTVDMSDTDNILGDVTKTTNWFLPGTYNTSAIDQNLSLLWNSRENYFPLFIWKLSRHFVSLYVCLRKTIFAFNQLSWCFLKTQSLSYSNPLTYMFTCSDFSTELRSCWWFIDQPFWGNKWEQADLHSSSCREAWQSGWP